MRGRHFQRHGRGVFKCVICTRSTRLVDQGNDHLCPECWELAGVENSVTDGAMTVDEVVPERDRLVAIIVKRGGNLDRVKKDFRSLWPD